MAALPVAQPGCPPLLREEWGVVPYVEALDRQRALHAARLAGEVSDTLVLVSHPAVVTLGRHAPEDDLALPREEYARRGIDVVRTDRGGRATYHGPGQVVMYPVVAIEQRRIGVKDWVCLLESALLDTLEALGIAAARKPATAGLWTTPAPGLPPGTGGAKIASLGLRVTRGISYHGVALNTGLDAAVFDAIRTCGVAGERVTSIAAVTGRVPDDAAVGRSLADHVERRLREAWSLAGPGRKPAACAAPPSLQVAGTKPIDPEETDIP